MTAIAAAIRAAAERLAPVSDTARLDAELMMAHALGMERSRMILHALTGAGKVPPGFDQLVTRRAGHEPVAYIIGWQEFFGHGFRVTPDVLIPRADSEVLVETALAARPDAARVLDCGTGSGALLISFLLAAPSARGTGIDRSAAALAVAQDNARRLGIGEQRGDFLVRDWTQPGWNGDLGRFDLVLANPPYVEDDAALAPSVRAHEPGGALFAGADGLDAYRVLIPQLPGLLAAGGLALVEIGFRQAEAVSAIAAGAGLAATLHHDLAGRPRALALQIPLGKAAGSA